MNKRRIHFGITQRTFILLIIGFLLILLMTSLQGFNMYKESYLDYEYDNDLSNNIISKFQTNYSLTNKSLNKYVKNYYSSAYGMTAILNTKHQIVTLVQNADFATPQLEIVPTGKTASSSLNVNITKALTKKIDAYIKSSGKQSFKISIAGTVKNLNEYYYNASGDRVKYPSSDQGKQITPTYMQLGNRVIISGSSEGAKTYSIMWYTSKNYTVEDASVSTSKEDVVVDNRYLLKQFMTIISTYNYKSNFTTSSSLYKLYKDVNGGTVYYMIGDLTDDNYTNAYPNGQTQGYYISLGYVPNLNNTILREYMKDNYYIYLISLFIALILAFLLSRTITRPIRKISRVTQEIANNDFSIKLKEKRRDEIGQLAISINTMSRNLNETIGKLNTEIDHVKELEDVRKQFIANFTHEIKTPLGVINGYSELLEDAQDDETRDKYIAIINEQTDRINKLVLAMLELNRLESGKVELSISDLSIEDMTTSVVDSFSLSLEKKKLKVKIEGEDQMIRGDRFKMEMVIKNFMSNAIKHTPEEGTIYIRIKPHLFELENEGMHLSERELSNIWETYVTSDREGTGLGLALCRAILQMHNFQYGVKNTQKGVLFYFEY